MLSLSILIITVISRGLQHSQIPKSQGAGTPAGWNEEMRAKKRKAASWPAQQEQGLGQKQKRPSAGEISSRGIIDKPGS